MVMQAIFNASTGASGLQITADTTKRSLTLAKYILQHKLALITDLPTSQKDAPPLLTKQHLLDMKANISNILTQDRVTARDIASNKRVPNARQNDRSRNVITSLSTNGFGEMVAGPNGSLSLKRKRVNEMNSDTRQLFYDLGIDEEKYTAAIDNLESDIARKSKKKK